MEQYKEDFIHFMIDCEVLRFGDFVTKSGRNTPFFINAGYYRTGAQLAKLGEYYAAAIREHFGTDFDILFGPAYKGIPLSVAATIALSKNYGADDIAYCADRKEVKDHGEGGKLLGAPINDGDRVLIIEDVTTAGTSIRENYPVIKAQAACEVIGLIVSVDRQERGTGTKGALEEIAGEFQMKTTAIVTMEDVVACLHNREYRGQIYIDDRRKEQIDAYYKEYGAVK